MLTQKALKIIDLLVIYLLSPNLEKTVLCQLNNFLSLNNLYSIYQSGYRTNHSCETAMLKVTNDI